MARNYANRYKNVRWVLLTISSEQIGDNELTQDRIRASRTPKVFYHVRNNDNTKAILSYDLVKKGRQLETPSEFSGLTELTYEELRTELLKPEWGGSTNDEGLRSRPALIRAVAQKDYNA